MSITLHDLMVTGSIPPFEANERIESYVRRVYRAGVIAGVSWGVGMVAPIQPVIQPPEPLPDLSNLETSEQDTDEVTLADRVRAADDAARAHRIREIQDLDDYADEGQDAVTAVANDKGTGWEE